MGYKLNRVVQKEEQAAAYTRKELELMSEYRLREVCLREHIVKGLDKSMTNEELIEMILSYCQTFEEDLIREEKEGGSKSALTNSVSKSPRKRSFAYPVRSVFTKGPH